MQEKLDMATAINTQATGLTCRYGNHPTADRVSLLPGISWSTSLSPIAAICPLILCSLSTLLAEAMQDDLYLDAAKVSADFICAHLYNANNIMQDSISARADDSCMEAASEFSSDSGVVIEGLAILYYIMHSASIQDM
jgi:hypothetical protein